MDKRISCRAVIVENEKLVTMYREKKDRIYYTFPGGGINEGETETDCVKRECLEEFGIVVEPVCKLYEYEDAKTIQNYYLCKWVSGELGTGEGEEFEPDRNRGIYVPTLMAMDKVTTLPLVPEEVASIVDEDYKNNNLKNRKTIKKIVSTFNG